MDVTDLTQAATSTPQEAVSNIKNATVAGTTPTNDPSVNQSIQPVVDQLAPTQATPAVADYMGTSTEHSALVIGDKTKPQESDIHPLNFIDSTTKFVGDLVYDRPNEDQELSRLAMKKSRSGGQLNDDDKYRLWELNQNREATAAQAYNEPPQNPVIKTAEAVAQGVGDAARGLRHNYKLIASFAGAGALIEASATEGLGTIQGGILGLRAGVAASFAKDAYDSGFGGTYNELDRMKNPDGTPLNMDETTKSNLAQGVGLTSAIVMGAAGMVTAKGTPWLNAIISPKIVSAALQQPANAVLRGALTKIGSAVTSMGAAAAFTEVARIYAAEAAHTYDGTEVSFLNALKTTADKLSDAKMNPEKQRVNQAFATGAGTGLLFGGGMALLNRGSGIRPPMVEPNPLELPAGPSEPPGGAGSGPVIEGEFSRLTDEEFHQQQTKATTDKLTGQKEFLEKFLEKPNLTDQQKMNLQKELGQVNGQLGVHNELSNIPPEAHAAVDDAVKVLKFQDSMEEVAKAAGNTKMHKLAPQETQSVMTKVMERSGISKLYVNPEFWQTLLNPDAEKLAAANNTLDPSGLTAMKMNQPIEVSAVEVMSHAINDSEILEHVSLKPGGFTPMSGRSHLEGLMDADEKRKKIFTQLGIKPEEVQAPDAPSNVVPIGSKKPEEQFNLDAHVNRTQELLDQNKQAQEEIDAQLKVREDRKKDGAVVPLNSANIDLMRDEVIKKREDLIAKNTKELEDIKSKVTGHFQSGAQGSLLVGNWDEPGPEDSSRAASDFVNEPTYTEALEKVLPKPEVQKFNVAHQNARKEIADNIKETAVNEMNKVQDQMVEEQKDIRRQEEIARIATDPNYAIIEKFRRTQVANSQGKKKASFYSIDPETVPKSLMKYVDSPRIKELGVFKKGGQNLDDVARLLGVDNGEQLLKIFANTPSREQVARARAKAHAVADEQAIRETDDLNHRQIIAALNSDMANQRDVMKFMREKEWPATKGAFKRIALYPPNVEEWNQRGKDMVLQTRVGSLNPNVYRIGEKKSHRIAVKEILKMNPEAAFMALEQRGINLAALKESYLTISKINRGFKFARKFNDKGTMELLKKAGPTTYNAAVEILNVFKLSRAGRTLPVGQEQGPNGNFLKWATREAREGRGDFSIPDRLTDLRQSANDMTAEQFLVIIDRLRAILNEAKLHGRLMDLEANEKANDEAWDLDRFAEKLMEQEKTHPAMNKDLKFANSQGDRHGMAKMHHTFASLEAMIAPKQSIYLEADRGQSGGFVYRAFDEEMERAFTYEKERFRWVDENLKRLFKEHGSADKLEKMLEIPELKGIFELNNGALTKADLLCLMANRGQQYTKDILKKNNGGVSDELWQTIFDRELNAKDVKYMQGIVDLYKDPELRAKTILLQRLEGRDITFIEGIPYTHRGVTYPGGYIRARYAHPYTKQKVETQQKIEKEKGAIHYDKDARANYAQYASETTDQGYTVARTDSPDPIKYAFYTLVDGLREIIHDHAYRVPMRNFWAKMDHPDVIPTLIKMVGEPKVQTLIDINLELANRPKQKDDGYFSDSNRMIKAALGKLGRNFATSVIWGNISAVIKQLESFPEMATHLGPAGMKHYVRVLTVYSRNPDKFWGYMASARKLDPNLDQYFVDGIDDDVSRVTDRWVPRKRSKTLDVASAAVTGATTGALLAGPIGAVVGGTAAALTSSLTNRTYDAMMTAGFLPHQAIDALLKGVQAHAVLSWVLSGDHPMYPKEKLATMEDDDKWKAVTSAIQQLSSITQVQTRPEFKAPVQKNLLAKILVLFWNYPRTVLNNTILDARRSSWKFRDAYGKLGEGGGGGDDGAGGGSGGGGGGGGDSWNPAGAAKDAASGANIALTRIVIIYVSGMILHFAAKRTMEGFFPQEKVDWKNPDSWAGAGMHMVEHVMETFAKMMLEVAPSGKNVTYALESKKKYQMIDVKDPLTQAMSSGVGALEAVYNMIALGHNPSRMQLRSMLEAESYFLKAFPVRGWLNSVKWMEQNQMVKLPEGFHAQFDDKKVENAVKEMKDFVDNPKSGPKDFVAEVDNLHKQLAPAVVEVPKEAADTIKMAESGGKWNAPNGLYGFSKENWKEIMHSAPDLGLTENGRTAKDTSQQEKAMDWSLNDHAARLTEKDIPVNSTTLYEAHKLGVDTYLKLFNASANEKVKTAMGNSLDSHPDLANFKTIGQVKSYLRDKAESGQKALATDKALTSKTTKNED